MRDHLVAALVALALAGAQGAPPSTQTAPDAPRPAAATLSGRVVTPEGLPVRRAIVSLTGPTLGPSRGAITDDEGRFALGHLPAGRVALTATRPGFLTSAYGARRPGRPGQPITIAEGQALEDLRLTIWRGAVITGTVRDEVGAPVPNVAIHVLGAHPSAEPGLRSASNSGTVTDDEGVYRLFGLEPGSYVVSATVANPGGVTSTATLRHAEVDAVLDALEKHAPLPAASGGSLPTRTPTTLTYAPVYFPGTSSLGEARAVTVVAGDEREGIDIPLMRVPVVTVSGRLVRSDGQPAANAQIELAIKPSRGAFVEAMVAPLRATSSADGAFRLAGVPPGDYRLTVLASGDATAGSVPRLFQLLTPPPSGAVWSGGVDVTAAGQDVADLTVLVQPGLVLKGQLVFPGGPPPNLQTWQAALVAEYRLRMTPGVFVPTLMMTLLAKVHPDGTFEIANIPPGRFAFQLTGEGIGQTGWRAVSALAGPRDLLDGITDFAPSAAPATVVVQMSDEHDELTGSLGPTPSAALTDVYVLAYPRDARLWTTASRRIQGVRPDVDGQFAMSDLPAGDYWLAVLTGVDRDEWLKPSFLESLTPTSVAVTVRDGERTIQNLRIK